MKEYEDIFGAQTNNASNEELETSNVENIEEIVSENVVEENEIPNVEVEEVNSVENVNPVLDSVFPSYIENVETVMPVEEITVEENEEVVESTDVNNVFGEDVVETTEEVVNPVIPDYSESVEPVMPVEVVAEESEQVVEPTDVNNVFGEDVVETAEEVVNPVIPDYTESVEPVMPVEVVAEESEISTQETTETNYNPMEHPDAKIVLNKDVEEKEEVDPEIKNMKVMDELKSNSSLKFVLLLGIVLLIIIFAIPYISELLG